MAGYLVESNIYSPAISKVDSNNDEANLQLANRTRYLNNALNDLTNYLGTLKDTTDLQIEDLSKRINQIRAVIGDGSSSSISTSDDVVRAVEKLLRDVSALEELLQTHKHNYAGSSSPGGPAGEVAISDDTINRLSLLGVDSAHQTSVKRNTSIYMEEDGLFANVFHGTLDGEASSAETLSHSPVISLTGDAVGTAVFEGNRDVSIAVSLKDKNVSPGEYGELSNYTLPIDGSLLIPSITVNAAGIITRIQNRVVQLPSNLGTNNSISAPQDPRKLFLVGASSQGKYASTYSQSGVYEKDNKLYSNNDEVATVNERQDLLNKTINGYIPNDAMERAVDNTVGGTINSNAVITSDAVARHTHNYAASSYPSGPASQVEVEPAQIGESYRVAINKNNKLYISSVSILNDTLISKNLMATENMYIPGGKVWIENVEPSEDSGGNLMPGDFLNPDDYVKRISTDKLNTNVESVHVGQLLSYHSNGYHLADNGSKNYSKNLAIALTDSDDAKVMDIITFGAYNLGTNYYDGTDAYVGKQGDILFGKPSEDDIVVRKIGYVKDNYLMFMPSDNGSADRVDSLEKMIDRMLYPDQANFVWQLDSMGNYIPKDDPEIDGMWDVDEEGDIMPAMYCIGNDFWEMEDKNTMMPSQIITTDSSWEFDEEGNIIPLETYQYDSVWDIDELDDIMPSTNVASNEVWESDEEFIMPGDGT